MTRPHGYARYRLDGCRCYTCAAARSAYDEHRTRLIAYGRWQPFVGLEETQQRIGDLKALGFGDRGIATLAGLGRKTVRDIAAGVRHDPGRGNHPMTKIRAETAAAIAAIPYDPLAAPDHALIDATLTWDRIHALIAAGYTRTWIAHQLGSRWHGLQLNHRRVTAANARAVLELLGRVGNTPGPSARARNEGRRHGWPLPGDLFDEMTTTRPAPHTGSRLIRTASEILADLEETTAAARGWP